MIEDNNSAIKRFKNFNIIVVIIIFLCFINIFYKISFSFKEVIVKLNLWHPTWLLFGPLLYFALKEVSGSKPNLLKRLIHLTPFAISCVYYLYTFYNSDESNPWASNDFIYYQNSYFLLAFSLFGYSIYSFIKCSKISKELFPHVQHIIISLSVFFTIMSIIYVMMYLAWGIFHIDTIIDYRFFNYGILFLVALLLGRYLIIYKPIIQRNLEKKNGELNQNQTINENFKELENIVRNHLNKSKVFLDPVLKLDTLSQDLNISKKTLSYLFNNHFKTNFYQFVAEYRIKYSIELMKNTNNIYTIESLANFSGFNSRSAFNKYFKEFTGVSPSKYQMDIKKITVIN